MSNALDEFADAVVESLGRLSHALEEVEKQLQALEKRVLKLEAK